MVVTRRSARLASSEEETPAASSKINFSPKTNGSPKKLKNGTPVKDNFAANGPKKGEDSKKEKSHPMVIVVFFSLLLDLLAFTMILPLLPALMELYRNKDDSGLFQWLLAKVEYFQLLLGVPDRYNSVLFGGKYEFNFCLCCDVLPIYIFMTYYMQLSYYFQDSWGHYIHSYSSLLHQSWELFLIGLDENLPSSFH